MSLRELRIEAGLSQKELGERVAKALTPPGEKPTPPKYYQPRISAYESGRNVPSLNVAAALVAALNKALKKAGSDKSAKIEDLLTKKPRR